MNEDLQPQETLNTNTQQDYAPVMSVKEWLIMFLISMIPIAGLVMVFVWAFSKDENPNKKNYAVASLIFTAIFLFLYFLFLFMFFALMVAAF